MTAKEFHLTPSEMWLRCPYCAKLLPSHHRRFCTIALHLDVECAKPPDRKTGVEFLYIEGEYTNGKA